MWCASSRNERLMILATERTLASEATPGWQAVRPDLVQAPVTEQVQLGGLSLEDTIRCAAAVTGYAIDASAGRALHRDTKGNPFFVNELARGPEPSMTGPFPVLSSRWLAGVWRACRRRRKGS